MRARPRPFPLRRPPHRGRPAHPRSFRYTSPYLHHVLLTGLTPATLYFYQVRAGREGRGARFACARARRIPNLPPPPTPARQVGGGASGTSPVLNFTSQPAPGLTGAPMTLAIIGDLGQTSNSADTLAHILQNPTLTAIMHVGDLSCVWLVRGATVRTRAHARDAAYPAPTRAPLPLQVRRLGRASLGLVAGADRARGDAAAEADAGEWVGSARLPTRARTRDHPRTSPRALAPRQMGNHEVESGLTTPVTAYTCV